MRLIGGLTVVGAGRVNLGIVSLLSSTRLRWAYRVWKALLNSFRDNVLHAFGNENRLGASDWT